jgi:prevent-host-death family protein
MKTKRRKPLSYPEAKETAREIKEAAAAYGLKRDVVNVREAKDRLSSLLQRVAGGEQIVITSDGQPKAMIVRYRPVVRGKPWVSHRALRESMPMSPDSTPMIREMRDSSY